MTAPLLNVQNDVVERAHDCALRLVPESRRDLLVIQTTVANLPDASTGPELVATATLRHNPSLLRVSLYLVADYKDFRVHRVELAAPLPDSTFTSFDRFTAWAKWAAGLRETLSCVDESVSPGVSVTFDFEIMSVDGLRATLLPKPEVPTLPRNHWAGQAMANIFFALDENTTKGF